MAKTGRYEWTFPEDVQLNRALIQGLMAVLVEKKITTYDEIMKYVGERVAALREDQDEPAPTAPSEQVPARAAG